MCPGTAGQRECERHGLSCGSCGDAARRNVTVVPDHAQESASRTRAATGRADHGCRPGLLR
eukprot:7733703-Alexandrium_andersonii.AAC.1